MQIAASVEQLAHGQNWVTSPLLEASRVVLSCGSCLTERLQHDASQAVTAGLADRAACCSSSGQRCQARWLQLSEVQR